MRAWHWLGLLVCGGMTAIAIWRSTEKPIQPVAAAGGEAVASESVDTNEIATLREQTRDLARLRGEVMQLRAKKRELDAAKQQNAQLLDAQRTGAPIPHETPAGFVSKDKLANVGYATPDDAVQTFFWAVREGNINAVVQSLSPDSRERQRIEKLAPEDRAKLEREISSQRSNDPLQRFTDMGVRAREMISDDRMALHVGSSFSTNTMRFEVQRTPEGWKLRDPL
jgi:hypothetical protein